MDKDDYDIGCFWRWRKRSVYKFIFRPREPKYDASQQLGFAQTPNETSYWKSDILTLASTMLSSVSLSKCNSNNIVKSTTDVYNADAVCDANKITQSTSCSFSSSPSRSSPPSSIVSPRPQCFCSPLSHFTTNGTSPSPPPPPLSSSSSSCFSSSSSLLIILYLHGTSENVDCVRNHMLDFHATYVVSKNSRNNNKGDNNDGVNAATPGACDCTLERAGNEQKDNNESTTDNNITITTTTASSSICSIDASESDAMSAHDKRNWSHVCYVAPEYPGYSPHDYGKITPTEISAKEAALDVYRHMKQMYPCAHFVIIGLSLGSGVASWLITHPLVCESEKNIYASVSSLEGQQRNGDCANGNGIYTIKTPTSSFGKDEHHVLDDKIDANKIQASFDINNDVVNSDCDSNAQNNDNSVGNDYGDNNDNKSNNSNSNSDKSNNTNDSNSKSNNNSTSDNNNNYDSNNTKQNNEPANMQHTLIAASSSLLLSNCLSVQHDGATDDNTSTSTTNNNNNYGASAIEINTSSLPSSISLSPSFSANTSSSRLIRLLVLISPFSSIRELAHDLVPGMGALVPQSVFQSDEALKSLDHHLPVQIIHGRDDALIPVNHSRRLHRQLQDQGVRSVSLNIIDGTHSVIDWADSFSEMLKSIGAL